MCGGSRESHSATKHLSIDPCQASSRSLLKLPSIGPRLLLSVTKDPEAPTVTPGMAFCPTAVLGHCECPVGHLGQPPAKSQQSSTACGNSELETCAPAASRRPHRCRWTLLHPGWAKGEGRKELKVAPSGLGLGPPPSLLAPGVPLSGPLARS